MSLDSRSSQTSLSPVIQQDNFEFSSANSSDTSLGSNNHDLASLSPSTIPTPTLLVTNLPTILFSQRQDLHPLLLPFGAINKLEIVEMSGGGDTTIMVQYESATIAQEAKEALQGQIYGRHQIEAAYVRSNTSAPLNVHNQDCGSSQDVNTIILNGIKPGLNAFSAPFPSKSPRQPSSVLLESSKVCYDPRNNQYTNDSEYPHLVYDSHRNAPPRALPLQPCSASQHSFGFLRTSSAGSQCVQPGSPRQTKFTDILYLLEGGAMIRPVDLSPPQTSSLTAKPINCYLTITTTPSTNIQTSMLE